MRSTAAAALLLFAVGSAGAAEPTAKERALQVLARRPYQLELPKYTVDPALPFGSLGPGFTRFIVGLAYVAVLVALGALIFALVQKRDRRDGVERSLPAGSTARPVTSVDPPRPTEGPTLAEADRIAASGDYRAAIHTLLLVAIEDGARLTSSSFPPSTTARELTHILPLEGASRDGFRRLVRAVERSLFAGKDVGADEYTACRAHCVAVGPWRIA